MTRDYFVSINYLPNLVVGHIILENDAYELIKTGMYCIVPTLIQDKETGELDILDLSVIAINKVVSIENHGLWRDNT